MVLIPEFGGLDLEIKIITLRGLQRRLLQPKEAKTLKLDFLPWNKSLIQDFSRIRKAGFCMRWSRILVSGMPDHKNLKPYSSGL